jgi:hypothetical protein
MEGQTGGADMLRVAFDALETAVGTVIWWIWCTGTSLAISSLLVTKDEGRQGQI